MVGLAGFYKYCYDYECEKVDGDQNNNDDLLSEQGLVILEFEEFRQVVGVPARWFN